MILNESYDTYLSASRPFLWKHFLHVRHLRECFIGAVEQQKKYTNSSLKHRQELLFQHAVVDL